MDKTTEDLLREVEAISLQIAELESAIEQARSRGRGLFREFQRRQVGLAESFGLEQAAPKRSARGVQVSHLSVASRIMVSATRLVNELKAQGHSAKEIRAHVLGAALKVARNNGLSAIPDEALARIEERIKRKGMR